MRLVFTKGAGKYDRLDIVTADGPLAAIDCPKQGIIPHDMVHFAVESEVVTIGFLGNIAAGGDSGFRAGMDDRHAQSVERLVETVQAEAWGGFHGSGGPVPFAEFADMYRVTCEARGDPVLALMPETLAAIRARLSALMAAWAAVAIGGTLVLDMPAPSSL
ncbi:hypothetical protein [Sandarakinorhabdus sp.]|uniref:hypothetical protein n=1 Tax=Sandarakinorhabdus sp. TaxID=1916663 RepID=UPI00286DD763|nr:hypothetical protein [Sandarakinorhabdus sp.]